MMGNQVYANNMEISCKAANGKSICAFPDVCFTPPQTPATPPGVPIPYPNTGMASDTTDGSTTVKISGQEVMLKNKSYFKRSMGDEAGCAPQKGVVSMKNMGKVYFRAWSMDVKIEGENVVRNMDLTTHNHASEGPNAPPQMYVDRMAMANIPGCQEERTRVETACDPPNEKAKCPSAAKVKKARKTRDAMKKAHGDTSLEYQNALAAWDAEMTEFSNTITTDPCHQAMRCLLGPYKPSKCCPGQTPHHLVEASSFHDKGRVGGAWKTDSKSGETEYIGRKILGTEKYKTNKAPCICVEGENQTQATHGLMHTAQNELTASAPNSPPAYAAGLVTDDCQTLSTAQTNGAKAAHQVFGCSESCSEAQLKAYHEQECDMAPGQPIRKVEA